METILITVVNGVIQYSSFPSLDADLVKKFKIHTTLSSLRRAGAVRRMEVIPDTVTWAKDLTVRLRFEDEKSPVEVTSSPDGHGGVTITEKYKVSLHVLSSDINRYLLVKSISPSSSSLAGE